MSRRSLIEEIHRQARRRSRRAVHKRQLVTAVARHTSFTRVQVGEALDGILKVIAETMAEGDRVTLVGFSRFEANEHRPRIVQGRGGHSYHVESRLVPSLHSYPSLRRLVLTGGCRS